MTSLNDLQSVADKLLELSISIKPTEDQIELLSDTLRTATSTADKGLRFASSLGLVETKQGANGVDSTKLSLDKAAFDALPEKLRNELIVKRVVFTEVVKGRRSKPAVSIRPVYPTQQQAAAA